MRNFLILLLFLGLAFSIYAEESVKLRIHGSNTIGQSLAPELIKSWLLFKGYKIISNIVTAKEERFIVATNSSGKLEVEIQAHGSSTSFRDFAAGKTDIGMSSRPIKLSEIKKLASLGQLDSQHSEYVVALDGLPVIVHQSNQLSEISKANVKKIFSGEINNWSQLGLKPGWINVYARDNNSGTYDTFKSLVLGKKTPLHKRAKRFESNTILSDSVAKDPSGIGFVGLAYVRKAKVLAISDIGTRALLPEKFTVATEDYVLSRRLYMYIPEKNPHPLAREFVNYAASAAADHIVTKVGFIAQDIKSYKINLPKNAPDEYRELANGAVRLSLNIRFKAGSITLDNKAVRDVERLVGYLKRDENKDKKLMLFGFADKTEVNPYMSHSFSVSRSDAVADYLVKNKIYPVKIRGYGQELPVADNVSQSGRNANRRVEIWMM